MVQVILNLLLCLLLVTVVMATKPVLIALPKNQTANVGDEARISCEVLKYLQYLVKFLSADRKDQIDVTVIE